MAAQRKRDQIIVLRMNGMKNYEVIKQLNVCRKTVINVEKFSRRANNLTKSNSRNKPFSSYQGSHCKYRVKKNPRSVKKMTKELHISDRSLRRIDKEKLEPKPYKI